MILKIFSCFDSKIGSYGKPFFVRSVGEALREYVQVSNDDSTMIGKHPQDFCLFHIGNFDDETASIEMLECPHSLGVAKEFVKED